MVLYVSLILPAFVAMGFCCIWICQQSVFPWLHNKIKLQHTRMHLAPFTNSPSRECRQLAVTSTDISQYNSTGYNLVSDRFPNASFSGTDSLRKNHSTEENTEMKSSPRTILQPFCQELKPFIN